MVKDKHQWLEITALSAADLGEKARKPDQAGLLRIMKVWLQVYKHKNLGDA